MRSNKRSKAIQAQVTPELFKWVTEKALEEERSMSNFVNRILVSAMEDDLEVEQ